MTVPRETDLEFLTRLGVTVENIANRVGRTVTLVQSEMENTRQGKSNPDE